MLKIDFKTLKTAFAERSLALHNPRYMDEPSVYCIIATQYFRSGVLSTMPIMSRGEQEQLLIVIRDILQVASVIGSKKAIDTLQSIQENEFNTKQCILGIHINEEYGFGPQPTTITEITPGSVVKAILAVYSDHAKLASSSYLKEAFFDFEHKGPAQNMEDRLLPFLKDYEGFKTALDRLRDPEKYKDQTVNRMVM